MWSAQTTKQSRHNKRFCTQVNKICWWKAWHSWHGNVVLINNVMLSAPKSLRERMVTHYQRCSVAFTWEQFHEKGSWTWYVTCVQRLHFKNYFHITKGPINMYLLQCIVSVPTANSSQNFVVIWRVTFAVILLPAILNDVILAKHSVESPSMVDPQWNIWYWGSKWNLHTVCWSVVGCEWGITSVYFGNTYVCFIPSRLPVFAVEPQYLLQYFYFCQKYHLNYTYKIFKTCHVGLKFEWGL